MKVKLVSVMMVLCMTAALLTGCGDSGSGGKGDTSAGTDNGEKITLKLFHNWINVEEAPILRISPLSSKRIILMWIL